MKKTLSWMVLSSLVVVSAHAQNSDTLTVGAQSVVLAEGTGVESDFIMGVVNANNDGQVLIYEPGSSTYISDIVYAAAGDLYIVSDGEASLTQIAGHPVVGSFTENGLAQDISAYFTDPSGAALKATVQSDIAVPEPSMTSIFGGVFALVTVGAQTVKRLRLKNRIA